MTDTIGLAFIHGAGLGAWIWKDVMPFLEVPALALDFPDRGKQAAAGDLRLEDYSRRLAEALKAWEPSRIVLVAHSIGGVVGLRTAAELGERLSGFVAVGAAIPKDGGSFLSCLPFPGRLIMPWILRLAGTRPPAAAIRKGLCSDLDEERTDRVVRSFVPEARALYTDSCDAPPPATRNLYLKLGRDREFPPALQEAMARNLVDAEIESLDCGHLPMLSRPKELADALNRFIRPATAA